jgi:hypothetical protein
MCRPRVGEANPLFSLCRALWRPTALLKITKAVALQRNLGPGRLLKVLSSITDMSVIALQLFDRPSLWSRLALFRAALVLFVAMILPFFVSYAHWYMIVVIVVHPVFRSPFCFISSLSIAMLAPPMILSNQLIYSINTPLAIYFICSLCVPWLANNKAFVCLFVVYVNYDLWINLLRYVKWVVDPGDTFEKGE